MTAREDVASASGTEGVEPVTADGCFCEIREGGRVIAKVFVRVYLDESRRPMLVAEVPDGVEVIRVKEPPAA